MRPIKSLLAAGLLCLAAVALTACGGDLSPRQMAAGLSMEYAVIQDAAIDFMDTDQATPAIKDAIKAADAAAIKGLDAVVDAAKATPEEGGTLPDTKEGDAAQSRFTGIYDYAKGLIASLGSLVGV